MTEAATVTALIDNHPGTHKALKNEHGLAFYIQTGGMKLLFDCGASNALLHNAALLGIDLTSLDMVVLSHGHYDHTGGFCGVAGGGIPGLLTGRHFFAPKFSVEGMRHTFLGVGFDAAFLAKSHIRHDECGAIKQLAEGCWAIGDFDQTVPEETIPQRFQVRKNDIFVPDLFVDEICLAVRMDDGVAVLAGCSHPGIVTMAQTVAQRLNMPVRGIWGGTHLSAAGLGRITMTLARLKALGVTHLGLSHCSGERMAGRIAATAGMHGCRMRTGDGVVIRASRPTIQPRSV